jgi:hypothetical protein
MLGEPRLNVYVLESNLSPRVRQRLQAQVQTAIRSLPRWTLSLLTDRMNEMGATGLPLIVEPAPNTGEAHPLGLGEIDGCPAARLRPHVSKQTIEWTQDPQYLAAKAVGYLASPPKGSAFWQRWAEAVDRDRLREAAAGASPSWEDTTDAGLLLEMFAAYALRDGHENWSRFPAVNAFLREWRGNSA